MDTFELMTAVRNITRLHSENELSNKELLRNINLAYDTVCAMMYPLFKQDLVVSLTESSQTGDYAYPKDVLLFINIYRKNASAVFKYCNVVDIENKPLIGTVSYPSDADRPIVTQVGSLLSFTPALSSTDIKIEYRKRIAPLIFGIGTSSAGSDYITLDPLAPVRDDVLNYYWLALYKESAGVPYLQDVVKITDYDGSDRKASCTTQDDSQAYTYALVPILPDEFHHFIVDMTLVYLAMADYYKKEPAGLRTAVMEAIIFTLKSQGIEYSLEGK